MDNHKIESVQDLFISYLTKDISVLQLINQIDFQLKYNDPKLKGEVTTPYIEMLSGYQESVFYAYLILNGRDENLIYLKDNEKKALNLKFKVEKGSDIFRTMLENLDQYLKIIEGAISKMTGEQILVAIALMFGYLTVSQLIKLVKDIKERRIQFDTQKLNTDRETALYKTFESIIENMQNKKFDTLKQESLHKPLYEYPNNQLITAEENITSEQALAMRIQPEVTKQVMKGIFMVDGIRGASSSKSHTTFWLIDEKDDYDFSVQLGTSALDVLRRGMLYENIGKHIYLDFEVIRKDGIIKAKKINALETEKTSPEKFL